MSSLRPVSGTAEEISALLRSWHDEASPEPLVIETSGSTGRPKRVMLSRDAMRASALATFARLGGPGLFDLNLPATYVAGVQVLFRNIVAPGDRRYLSLVPTQLVRRLDDPELTAYDAVLVGGGPLDPRVRAQAEATGIPVVQTYGMSETCGGCVYDGVPLDGVAVKVSEDGEVLISGPVLFDGYEDGRDSGIVDGWLRTNDLGRFDHDGRLRILGRADDVIISGGVKVPAHAVEQMLRDVAARVVVLGVPDREWGERVVAVLDAEVPLEKVRDLVTPREWAPREVRCVRDLPLLPNGKVDKMRLRELVR